MEIAFASSPGASADNEDWVGATPEAVVVLDGLTSPPGLPGRESGCLHGTQWYVRSLGTRLLQLLVVRPNRPLGDVLENAIADIADTHANTCDLDHPGTPSATVGILRAGPAAIDYLVLSDVVIVLDTDDGFAVSTDARVEQTAAELRRAVLAERIGTPAQIRWKQQMALAQRRQRNVPGGYWVAGARPCAARQAVTGAVARERVRRAAALTDGAAALVEYGLADWPAALDILAAGPAEFIRRLRAAEAADPHGERWPRYKAGDDATAAICTLRHD